VQSQNTDFNSDAIVEASDLLTVIEEFGVSLKRQGRERVGLCPFHAEKTPSFSVNPDKQVYLCRGCGAKGNVVTFVADMRGTENDIAMEWLAERAGLPFVRGQGERKKKRQAPAQPVFEVLSATANVFQAFLRECATTQQYLQSRKITGEQAVDFKLGFAPADYDLMAAVVSASGLPESSVRAVLRDTGLLRSGGNPFFVDRLIFPITNEKGQICAFAGRALSERSGPGKYLNSIENDHFHKRETLYGLTPPAELPLESRKRWHAINQSEIVYVVEGYTDVLALQRHGVLAVAAMGTAFTEGHFRRLLRRGIKHLRFCFDGDNAGREAAKRATDALITLVQDDQWVEFVQLPHQEDPDSFVESAGRCGLEDCETRSLATQWLGTYALPNQNRADTPEGNVWAHSALDRVAGEMKARMLVLNMRHAINQCVGPHPLEQGPRAPDPDKVHPAIAALLAEIFQRPDLLWELDDPSDPCDDALPERGLVGMKLIRQAATLDRRAGLSGKWELATYLAHNGYPSAWLRSALIASEKKAPSMKTDDAKALWRSCLRFAAIQARVGLIWPLSK
jgi:DNA primase catalytic core